MSSRQCRGGAVSPSWAWVTVRDIPHTEQKYGTSTSLISVRSGSAGGPVAMNLTDQRVTAMIESPNMTATTKANVT